MGALRHSSLTRVLLRSDGLLAQAEAALRRTVATAPDDAAALLRLGDVLRGKGKLGGARGAAARRLGGRFAAIGHARTAANSIVFFPGACVDQVAAIESESQDFADVRFAILGGLRDDPVDEETDTAF